MSGTAPSEGSLRFLDCCGLDARGPAPFPDDPIAAALVIASIADICGSTLSFALSRPSGSYPKASMPSSPRLVPNCVLLNSS